MTLARSQDARSENAAAVGTPAGRVAESACERRRGEILDAATELFAEHGYSDAVTQQLADRLQVGKGTIYRHFPSKRELFLAAVDRVMVRLYERLHACAEGVDDPLEVVARSVREYLRFFAEHPRYVELLIQERAQFKDRTTPTFLEHREKNVGRWRELYRSLIASGRVRDIPVDRITDVVRDLLYGTTFTNYFTGSGKPPEDQARDVLDVLFFGILSGPPAAAEPARPGPGP